MSLPTQRTSTRSSVRPAPARPLEHRIGKNGATQWRGAMNLFWSKDNMWSAGLSAYYIGSYADLGASINEATYQSLGQPSYVYKIDGVYYWKVDQTVTFNAFVARTFNFGKQLVQGPQRARRREEPVE